MPFFLLNIAFQSVFSYPSVTASCLLQPEECKQVNISLPLKVILYQCLNLQQTVHCNSDARKAIVIYIATWFLQLILYILLRVSLKFFAGVVSDTDPNLLCVSWK